MAYKIKKKQGLLRSFQAGERKGARKLYGVERRLHKKGEAIIYNGNLVVVEKSTKKGIYARTFKTSKLGIIEPSKHIFISEKDLKSGKAYPEYPMLPI